MGDLPQYCDRWCEAQRSTEAEIRRDERQSAAKMADEMAGAFESDAHKVISAGTFTAYTFLWWGKHESVLPRYAEVAEQKMLAARALRVLATSIRNGYRDVK